MLGFEKEIEEFTACVCDTPIYKNFIEKKRILKLDEGLWNQVGEYRRKKFEMQALLNGDEMFNRTESFEEEYRWLLSDTRVSEFLDAELAVCRLLQKISTSLIMAIDFE
ncbi:MAG: YlbF family regulator [Lachnospiraceae bacterium]|nr:YlbF family regulator [Lachnospiraceae bacterium]